MHTRLVITVWRIAMLYVVMVVCHVAFYLYNRDLIGVVEGAEVGSLVRGTLLFDNASIIYTSLLFLLLAVAPLPDRMWCSRWYSGAMFWSYIISASAMLALNMTDVVYFHYTQKRVTADEIFFADNGNTSELILTFMWENWYLVALMLLLVAVLVVGYRRGYAVESMSQSLLWVFVLRALFVVLVALFAVWGIRGGITRMTRPITMSNAMLYTQSPTKANMVLSNPFCTIRTMSKSVVRLQYFDDDTASSLFSPLHYPANYHSEMFGRYAGYNVVLVILESFSAEHSARLMAEEHSGEGYTPNLDQLMGSSLLFTRCYANGATSISAPPTIWSSTPSYESPFMLMSESLAECRPMPRLLRDRGYRTAFFCGSEHGSMGFGAYAHIAGIDELYSMDTYVERYPASDFDGKWGIWDEPFMRYMGEQITSFEEPFFASIFTLTSHHPFNVPEEVAGELPEGTTLNHRPVAYTDRAVARFMEQCRDKEWFERTLFVFVADHVSSERMAERTRYVPGNFQIVGFIYTPDGSLAQEYDHIVSQVDIMPTLLGLLGNDKPYFAMGRDIFNEPDREPYTLIRSGYGYVALMDDYIAEFDGNTITGVYRYDDIHHKDNLVESVSGERADSLIKATIQQYYKHVAEMDFIVE